MKLTVNRNSFHLWVQYRDLSNKHEQKTKTGKFEGWVMEIVADKMWVQTQVTLIVERSCRSVSVHVKFHIFYNIYIYIVSWWKLKGSLLLSVFFQLDRWNPE